MTNQEKKVWLLQYRRLDDRIDRLEKEKSRWIERATKMSAPSDGMPHGSDVSDTVGFAVSKAADLAAEIDREIDRLVDLRREIEDAIYTVDDPILQELLERRYIDGDKWEEIAVSMHYSWRNILRKHGKALSAVKIP